MKTLLIFACMIPLMLNAQNTRLDRPIFQEKINTQTTVNATVPMYKTGNWSAWIRKEGVEYRYRWGQKANDARYKTLIDAIYEVRNPSNQTWVGAVRTLKCTDHNQLSDSKRVVLKAQETQTVTFLTLNCGTVDKPIFYPNIVKSVRID